MSERKRPGRPMAGAWLSVLLAILSGAWAVPLGGQEETRSFYADRRAHLPGDLLTVLIVESASVTAAAQTQTNKSESAGVSVGNRLVSTRLSAGLDGQSAGGGQIDRHETFAAQLAVVVQSVDAAGNLTVHGEQDIQLNDERQHIRLDGVVRAQDIGPDNTILSSRVAGAHIELKGKGLLARKQSPGLINRILGWFWQ